MGDDLLGKGNFGRVVRGLDKQTGQFVAVKEINREKFDQSEIKNITVKIILFHFNFIFIILIYFYYILLFIILFLL